MLIRDVKSAEDLLITRTLFLEYAESLNFSLCFQSFDQELSELPGAYAEPDGALLLAFNNNQPAGCVAIRRISAQDCEMKRLYVRPQFRGLKVGYNLAETILKKASLKGYSRILLDTLSTMNEAVKLYDKLGFEPIESYTYNPINSAICMARKL